MKPLAFILIEGDEDERFFKKIIEPILKKKYFNIVYYQYSHETNLNFQNMIKTCIKNHFDHYLFGDINTCSIICERKEQLYIKSDHNIDFTKTIIIIKEIESWYLAGLSDKDLNDFNIKEEINNTDDMTKEKFINLKPINLPSAILFMQIILNKYNINIAIKKNKSFNFFYSLII